MGEIAAANSDITIITSDNPRSEAPGAILDEIAEGARKAGGVFEIVEDRRSAIETAITEAREGDVVLIAGKGHEDYQIIGTERLRFDDREEAAAAVERVLGLSRSD
jgi:UDP-N-acetylmuramoyl-L-alanyl-D-glutamate--2,6-diaminopimelate ligase